MWAHVHAHATAPFVGDHSSLLLLHCGCATLGTIVLLGFQVPPLLLQPIALQVMFCALLNVLIVPLWGWGHTLCVCVTTGHFVSPLCCSSTVVGLSASRCCTNALQIPATPNIPPQKPLNTQPPTTSPQHPAPSHNNHARRAVDLCPKSWLAPARAPGATPRLSTPETRNPQTQPPCRAPICPPLSTTSGTITATCILHADMPWSHHNPITPIASILPSPKSPHSLFTPYHHHLLSVKSKPLSRAHSAS